ncbi:6,7-dimethyl-8-ribityllumazine synthase [Chitinophagales bacterium]|nr:6,7-dimethyl-8-ribityllumazine synthase [Chitinophagales bacterium]
MSSADNNLSDYKSNTIPSGKDERFDIIVADWNEEITHALMKGCVDCLVEHEVDPDDIRVIHVPGTFELPHAAARCIDSEPAAVICIGCVITGETKHDEYICSAVSHGIMELNIRHKVPVIFGVLTPRNKQQALDRAGGVHGNKGVEAAVTALQMAALPL